MRRSSRLVRPIRERLQLLAVALLAVTTLLAAWGGWSWYAAAHDRTGELARARDQVLAAGEQAVQNLNTLDHASLAPGLDLWERSTTGELHAQLVQGRGEFEKQVRQAQSTTSARVLDAAVTELDERTGQAAVMVAVRITVRTAKETQPTSKDSRMLARLTRTAEGWKLSALGQAPMGTTGR